MALQSMQGGAQHAASENLDTVPSRPEDEGRTCRVALSAAASQADAAACALVDLQVKQTQFSERAQSLENTIASLRCTEAELSVQLQEISLLLVLSQHAPGRSIAARESSSTANGAQRLPALDSEQLQRALPNQEATPNSTHVDPHMAAAQGVQKGGGGGSGSGGGGEDFCNVNAQQDGQIRVNEERGPAGAEEAGTNVQEMGAALIERCQAHLLPTAQAPPQQRRRRQQQQRSDTHQSPPQPVCRQDPATLSTVFVQCGESTNGHQANKSAQTTHSLQAEPAAAHSSSAVVAAAHPIAPQATGKTSHARDTGGRGGGEEGDAGVGAEGTGAKRKFCVFWGRNGPSSRKSRWQQGADEVHAGAAGESVGWKDTSKGRGADVVGEAEGGGVGRGEAGPRDGDQGAQTTSQLQDFDGEPLSGRGSGSGKCLVADAPDDVADGNMSSTKTISSACPVAEDAQGDGCGVDDQDAAADELSQRAGRAEPVAQLRGEEVERQQERRGTEQGPCATNFGARSASRTMIPTSVKRRQMKTAGGGRAAGVIGRVGQGEEALGNTGAGGGKRDQPGDAALSDQPQTLSHAAVEQLQLHGQDAHEVSAYMLQRFFQSVRDEQRSTLDCGAGDTGVTDPLAGDVLNGVAAAPLAHAAPAPDVTASWHQDAPSAAGHPPALAAHPNEDSVQALEDRQASSHGDARLVLADRDQTKQVRELEEGEVAESDEEPRPPRSPLTRPPADCQAAQGFGSPSRRQAQEASSTPGSRSKRPRSPARPSRRLGPAESETGGSRQEAPEAGQLVPGRPAGLQESASVAQNQTRQARSAVVSAHGAANEAERALRQRKSTDVINPSLMTCNKLPNGAFIWGRCVHAVKRKKTKCLFCSRKGHEAYECPDHWFEAMHEPMPGWQAPTTGDAARSVDASGPQRAPDYWDKDHRINSKYAKQWLDRLEKLGSWQMHCAKVDPSPRQPCLVDVVALAARPPDARTPPGSGVGQETKDNTGQQLQQKRQRKRNGARQNGAGTKKDQEEEQASHATSLFSQLSLQHIHHLAMTQHGPLHPASLHHHPNAQQRPPSHPPSAAHLPGPSRHVFHSPMAEPQHYMHHMSYPLHSTLHYQPPPYPHHQNQASLYTHQSDASHTHLPATNPPTHHTPFAYNHFANTLPQSQGFQHNGWDGGSGGGSGASSAPGNMEIGYMSALQPPPYPQPPHHSQHPHRWH